MLMALASLIGLVRGPKIGPVQVDVSLEETHSQSAETSQHPIEDGSDIADHRRVLAPVVTMEGVVSDAKVTLREQIQSRITGVTAQDKYQRMLEAFEGSEVFELVTGLRIYADMVFETFIVRRNSETGNVVRFSATMKQLEFADSQEVPIQPVEDKAKPTTNRGAKGKKVAPAAATSESGSALFNVTAPLL